MNYRKKKRSDDEFFISPDFLASLKLDDEPIDYMDALWTAEAIALG
jgi:hypothetical protein